MNEKTQDLLNRLEAGEQVKFSASFHTKLIMLAGAAVLMGVGYGLVQFGSRWSWLVVGMGGLLFILNLTILFMPTPKLLLNADRMVVNKTTMKGKDDKDLKWSEIDMFYVSTGEMNETWVSFRTEHGDQELGDDFGCRAKDLADILNAVRVKFGN